MCIVCKFCFIYNQEGQKLRSEADESRRRLTYVQKENKKFTQQSVDLGQQVHVIFLSLYKVI